MPFKASNNLDKLRSRVAKDLAKKKLMVNLDHIGKYLVEKVKEEAKATLSDEGTLSDEYRTLIGKITYKIITDPNGNRSVKVGIFDDEPASKLMESIEYGSEGRMERPIFRKTLLVEEGNVVRSIKQSGGNDL